MENFRIEVEVETSLKKLLDQEDLNKDYKITVEDLGPKHFILISTQGQKKTISGTYALSNLLQLLALAHQNREDYTIVDSAQLLLNPVDALRTRIREEYWSALTRTLDEKGLLYLLEDPKTQELDNHRLYVPSTDPWSYTYFSQIASKHSFLKLQVQQLPKIFSEDLFKKLDEKPGLLALAVDPKTKKGVPFLVPGGRFNEMYGWDSYFILLGLIEDQKIDLAKGLLINFAYQIRHYHGTLNANRTYYLSRSNPPFFTSMIREFLPYESDSKWIREMLELAIKEYETIWCDENRLVETGLNRYYGGDLGVPTEVEKGHFESFFILKGKEKNLDPSELEKQYREGKLMDPEMDEYFIHDRSMRESGHDTTNRLIGVSAYLNPVDLNSLLYKVEEDIAFLIETYFEGNFQTLEGRQYTSGEWKAKAQERKQNIQRLLWSSEHGFFFDYHFKEQKPHLYESLTGMYPLFAGLCSQAQANTLIDNIIGLFEAPGGLVCSTKKSRGVINSSRPQRQWDYPFGWAPHQILFWKGAIRYGKKAIAQRLAYKWLYMITKEAMDYAGVLVEKYHVIQCSHKARAEYGNVGMEFKVYPKEGFGWVNASYQLGWSLLSQDLQHALKALKAPEELFK